MADLMKSAKTSIPSVRKGEIVEGVITKLTSGEILVDIGAKTEASVLEKDKNILRSILSQLKLGDKVKVSILNPESDFGNPVVSLRRFIDDGLWENLEEIKKKGEILEAQIVEGTRGGFLIETKNGISGFLPNSQTMFLDSSQNLSGHKLQLKLLELDRATRKIIFSQKAAADPADFNKLIKNLKSEQKISSTISSIAPFGVFLSIPIDDKLVEGFIHVSEISWEHLEKVPENFKTGEKIEAVLIGFDKKSSRVNLSVKRLTEDPYKKNLEKFVSDKKVTGTVRRVTSSGVVLDLGENAEGFIKKEKIPVGVSFKEGDEVSATVVEVDTRNHRVLVVPYLAEKPMGYR